MKNQWSIADRVYLETGEPPAFEKEDAIVFFEGRLPLRGRGPFSMFAYLLHYLCYTAGGLLHVAPSPM